MNFVYKSEKSLGILDTMFINRIIEIPLPTPFSVTRSPSHITKALPVVNVMITSRYPSGPVTVI